MAPGSVTPDAQRLVDEQTALRRVATLVAEGAAPSVVFDAVIAEVAELMGADSIAMAHFESGPEITVMAHRGPQAEIAPPGTRVPLDGESANATVRRTGKPVRIDDFRDARGAVARIAHTIGVTSTVGTPIVVDGALWGSMTVSWIGGTPPAEDAERRLPEFTALLGAAIANADGRAQLMASRARMVAAGDDARRRVVRDLHDGAQQRLVHTIVTLKLALRAMDEGSGDARRLVAEALDHATRSNHELRELAHGILPSVLSYGGLRAGVGELVSELDLRVTVDVPADRFSAKIEASAYFVIAEALTNVLKHARAREATVTTAAEGGMLTVTIRDDGSGGADPAGPGLVGLADRVSALGGRLRVESPAGGGTVVCAVLPVSA
jgi:signal transduction histidine kinase